MPTIDSSARDILHYVAQLKNFAASIERDRNIGVAELRYRCAAMKDITLDIQKHIQDIKKIIR
jgi:hypothetical protein